jgi:hypothetical protein
MLRKHALPVSFPGRKFHLDGRGGGHAGYVFRSPQTGYHAGSALRHEELVDFGFLDVAAAAVLDHYFAPELNRATAEETAAFAALLGARAGGFGDRKVYRIRGEGGVGYVAAGSLTWLADPDGDITLPSHLSTGRLPVAPDAFTDG